MKSNIKVELLSPVGSPDALPGVIKAGADAVYLSGEKYGARALATNFTDEELISAIRLSHILGVKVYLTVNTLFKENEIEELAAFLEKPVKEKLDGVIVQDIGVVNYIKKTFPQLPVHASTQMSVTGPGGASLLKQLGVTRVVCARELSLKDIIFLKKEADIEVETFIHGAMCYSFSGKCLFSSMLGGRSGNRGRCAQPCRLPYRIGESNDKPEYPLSMKDMCTVSILDKLIRAGIDSLKIEGRMKAPEYAAMVTAIYRKTIDEYYRSGQVYVSEEDMNILKSLYIRKNSSEGYYFKYNGSSMVTMESPAYKETSAELLKDIRDKFYDDIPRRELKIYCSFSVGEEILLTGESLGIKVSVKGPKVEPAINKPIDENALKKQLSKLNDTYFYLNSLDIEIDGNGFMPVGSINETRRNLIDKLVEMILSEYGN